MKIKTYATHILKQRDMENIEMTIKKLGFKKRDYRIVHFGNLWELKIINKELHWLVKSISKLERIKKVKRK